MRFHKKKRSKNGALVVSKRGPQLDTLEENPYAEELEILDRSLRNSKLNLRQIKAVRLMVTLKYTDEQVAHEVGVAVKTVQNWKADPKFKNAMLGIQSIMTVNAVNHRMHVNNILVNQVQDEILHRIAKGELRKLPLPALVKMMTTFSGESRKDDPQALAAKTEISGTIEHNVNLLAAPQAAFNLDRKRAELSARRAARLEKQRKDELRMMLPKSEIEDAEFVEVTGTHAS